ncbi:hypothetical protein HanHA300_Chr11g0384651 [Helianthus annuus]|nr:hypothetical protein HanHA300_Chr11g0384651 [Helianthus annuus]KAJ0507271.1 hypothetical protein HanIR_Chr11g0504441 [Helianthus annuus]
MATALASEIDEIWPPDMAKSSAVEERSLTAHRISEDNLVSGKFQVTVNRLIAVSIFNQTF